MSDSTVQKDFYVIAGKIPVLISAPHSHGHFRPSLSMVYKSNEPWSDVILQSVVKSTGAHGIYSARQLDYDPNYDDLSKNDYKAEVAAMIRQMKVKYFFDLHGLSDQHQYDFGIFFSLRFSKSKRLAYDFAAGMNKGALRHSVTQILNLPSNGRETLSEFVAKKLRVPALQIEVARYIREDDSLRGGLIENMSDFLLSLKF